VKRLLGQRRNRERCLFLWERRLFLSERRLFLWERRLFLWERRLRRRLEWRQADDARLWRGRHRA